MEKFLYKISSFIIISTSLLLLSYSYVKAEENNITKVKVRNSVASIYPVNIDVTGMSKASKDTIIKSEINGKIEKIFFHEGQKVKKGDILAIIEEKDRKTYFEYTKKLLEQREIEYNAAKSLEIKGYNSKVKLASARTNLEEAKNLLKQAETNLNNLNIYAPYDGIINLQMIEEGEFVREGSNLYEIISINPIEISAFLSEYEITKINKEKEVSVKFVNGKIYKGKINYISPKADEKNRTFEIKVSINNKNHEILSGMSASLRFLVGTRKLHKISPSLLSLNDDGVLGVKIVDKDNITRFIPIKIISEENKLMLIEGLNDEVTLITVGHEFVRNGTKVETIFMNNDGK